MEASGSDKKHNDSQVIKQLFVEGKDISTDLLLSSEENFAEYASLEETLVGLFGDLSLHFKNDSFSDFREKLDLAKAEFSLGSGAGNELPEFLKHYTNENLAQPVRKDSLILRLSNKGIQIIDSLLETVRVSESLEMAPSLRASAEAASQDTNSVVFEETTTQNQRFYYQIVKETPDEIYLSVKAETNGEGPFHQVNLKKDGRFILSSKISQEGTASFSGLKPGNYSIEFLAVGRSKSFDLSVLVG
ncbi:hypothetical protein [Leptospira sp. 'Mane']|uniref:hypothetical protein n=1 Tax=Leptospira sp. 'Mane' TaxID=3387407 RepID=UPI00398AF5D6